MYKNQRNIHRISGGFLLGLFILYWCGITLFMHSHVVNGVVVVHSHPFKAEHSHTKSQLETIFYLSILQTSGSVDAEVVLPLWLVPLAVIVSGYLCALSFRPNPDVCTRGPPARVIEY